MSMPQQGGFNLGTAYGTIKITSEGVEETARHINRSLGDGLQNIGGQIQSLGANLTVLTAPLLGFGAAGVRAASNFKDSLKAIQVRAGLTEEELAAVEQKSIDIGRTSIFGPGQAAEAFLQLLTTGMSVEDAMLSIDTVIAGAAASGQDLAFVADGLTDIMAGFGLSVEESNATMQTLIDATGASSADLPMLTAAMANVAPVAATFGFTVEETAAALAVLHENGIKGAEAGTALKSALLNIQRPTAEVQETLDRLGISTTDAQGNFKDLDTILQELGTAMDGLTPEERQRALFTLGGSFGMVGLSALLASDGIGTMTEAMGNQADITDIADSRLETFSGSMSFLQGSVELLMIRALTPLMDKVLAPMVQWIADIVNKLEQWITANPELAEKIVQILAVVAVLGPALVIVGTALSAIGGIIGVLLSPIGLLIAGVTALGVAWATNFMGIQELLAPALTWLSGAFERLVFMVQSFVSDLQNYGLAEAIAGVFGVGSGERGESTLEGFLVSLGLARDDAIAVVDTLWNAFNTIATFVTETVVPALVTMGEWFITTGLPIAFDTAKTLWETVLQPALNSIWAFVNDTLLPALVSFGDWFITSLPIAYDSAKILWDTVLQPAFNGLVTFVNDTLMPALGLIYDWFVTDALPAINNFIINTVVPTVQNFLDILSGAWELISPALQSLYDWFITTGLPAIKDFIENSVMPTVQGFIDLLTGIWALVSGGLTTLRDNMGEIFSWIKDNIIQPVIDAVNTLLGLFNSAQTTAQNTMNTVSNAVNSATGVGTTTNQLGQIGGAINSGQVSFGQVAGAFANEFGNAFGFASGTNFVTEDMLAMVHQGEAIVPASMNPYNPQAETNGLNSGAGTTFNVNVYANDEAGGRAAARGFKAEFADILRERDF